MAVEGCYVSLLADVVEGFRDQAVQPLGALDHGTAVGI